MSFAQSRTSDGYVRLFIVSLLALGAGACTDTDPDAAAPADDVGASGSTGAGASVSGGAGAAIGNDVPDGGQASGGAGGAGQGGLTGAGGSRVGSGGTNNGGSPAGGGAVGRAGGGGAGGAPLVVLPCDALPPPGQWRQISPPGDIGAPVALSVDPFQAGVIWVNMHKGGNGPHYPTDGLYKSTDCGATWLPRINTGTNGDIAATGPWTSMLIDPAAKGVIYAVQIYGSGGVYKSTNAGVDWTQLLPDTSDAGKVVSYNHIDSISMDPNDHLHIVIGTHAECHAPYGPACEAETTDGGATWHFVKLPLGGWEEGAGPWVLDATSWIYAGNSGLRLTTDHGATWSDVTPAGAAYYAGGEAEIHPIPRGPDGTYFLSSLAGIVESKDGRAWSLIPNSGGRSVGLTIGNGNFYSSDEWAPSLHTAKVDHPSQWATFPAPALAAGVGPDYLDYDAEHHVLYAGTYLNMWRIVTE